MKKYIIYLSVLFVSLANNALADRYYTHPTYANPTYQLNNNTSIKQNDYIQGYYNKNKLIRPYVGINVLYSDFKFSKQQGFASERPGTFFKDNAFGLAGIVGIKFHKYLGIEGFYKRTFKENKVTRVASTTDGIAYYDANGTTLLSSYGADLLVYLPVQEQLDILISVGAGKYNLKTEMKDQINIANIFNNFVESKKVNSTGARIGTGFQYNLKEEVYMRSMVHYIKMSNDDYIKHMIEVSLGLYYMF